MAEFAPGIEPGRVSYQANWRRSAARLAWYPREVWLWQLACQWRRIAQEEPFPGRAAEAGDQLGCRVLVARLVRDVMPCSCSTALLGTAFPGYGDPAAALPLGHAS